MHRSAVGDEKDLMLYDATPYRYASGGEVDCKDRIITDEVRRKMKALIESLPDDVEVESVYLQTDTLQTALYDEALVKRNPTYKG